MEVIYHIDEPTHSYEVADKKIADGYFYAVMYRASSPDIKVLKKSDKDVVWFYTKEACLYARVARKRRELELEMAWRDRKTTT